jgi:pimeloyl-ACP methyl ester carboxylesterase
METNTRSLLNGAPGAAPMRPAAAGYRSGYFVAGAGETVVMLHSSLGSKSQWTVLAERMSRRFHVIGLDLCGYGDNAEIAPEAPFTLDDEVRLISTRLDQLVEPHARIHVVGHSYGGLVAMRFAQCNRGRTASLTLYDPVVFRALEDTDAALADVRVLADRIVHFVVAGKRREAAQAFVDFWGDEGSFASLPDAVQDSIVRRIDKVPLDFRAALRWPLSPIDLRVITAPTLLLAGARSPAVVKRIIASLNGELPNRRVRWIDAGHMGPVTHAHRVNPWIETFVDLCTARGARSLFTRTDIAPASWAPAAQ